MSARSKTTGLLKKAYTMQDQEAFALLSGDSNPLHVDPVLARRTMLGGVTVHGLNLTMTAIEVLLQHLSKTGQHPTITAVTAQFSKPVFINENVHFQLVAQTPESCRIIGNVEETMVFRVNVQFGVRTGQDAIVSISSETAEPLVEAGFDALKEARGDLALALDSVFAARLFPHVVPNFGIVTMAEMLALTRLVGMRCPGLHSLFGQLDVRIDAAETADSLRYQVVEADERYSRLVIQVNGRHLIGNVQAFIRPVPVLQMPTGEVARSVPAGSFSNSVALIVGGSRGIGEVTAKIIAAGGGLPIITYYQGVVDAERVAADIRNWGGRCEVMQLDVCRAGAQVRRLFRGKNPPRSLYYFATPRIGGRRRKFFSYEMLDEFVEYYVTAFGRMVDAAATVKLEKLRVFYPSSIFAEEVKPETVEYSISKRMAEDLCAFYNRNSSGIEVIVERLPRINTDQNVSLLSAPADDAMQVMLPLVQHMEQAQPSGKS